MEIKGIEDLSELKAKFVADKNVTMQQLSDEYGVPLIRIRRTAKREGWKELRAAAERRVSAKLVKEVTSSKGEINKTYFRIVNKLLEKAEGIIDNAECWQPTILKEMTTAMKNLKDCLDVKSADELREQAARIAKLEREAEAGTHVDTTVTVEFKEDISKWSQ